MPIKAGTNEDGRWWAGRLNSHRCNKSAPAGVRQRGSPDPSPASSPPAAPVKEIRTDRHYPRIITWAPVVQVKTSLWHTDESRYGSVSVLPSCRR